MHSRIVVVFLLGMLAAVMLLLYMPLTKAWYCGYDDFHEMYRAEFVNAPDPSTVYRIGLSGSLKWRPLNTLTTLLFYLWDEEDPRLARWRNLLFQIICAMLVYTLARQWTGPLPAISASAFIGLHFLSHPVVAGAVWTNVIASALFLAGLLVFVRVRRGARPAWLLWGLLALCALAGAMFYDPVIVLIPACILYPLLEWLVGGHGDFDVTFILKYAFFGALILILYFTLRFSFVSHIEQDIRSVSLLSGTYNFAMLTGLMFLPVDPILLHDAFSLPLISRQTIGSPIFFVVATLSLFALLLVAIPLCRRGGWRLLTSEAPWPPVIFLVVAAGLYLAPVALFSTSVSFANVHLPLALLSIAGALSVSAAVRVKPWLRYVFTGLLCGFLVLSATSLSLRNRRVSACAETARRILTSLPREFHPPGSFQIGLAPVTGSCSSRTFGFYTLQGLETLGLQVSEDGVGEAVGFFFSNPRLKVRVGPEGGLPVVCSQPQPDVRCFFVEADGQVIQSR